jgi:hypothetical protein
LGHWINDSLLNRRKEWLLHAKGRRGKDWDGIHKMMKLLPLEKGVLCKLLEGDITCTGPAEQKKLATAIKRSSGDDK